MASSHATIARWGRDDRDDRVLEFTSVLDWARHHRLPTESEALRFDPAGPPPPLPVRSEVCVGDATGRVNVRVVASDCVAVVASLLSASVCLLNMASDHVPGGGVRKGSMAQEEDICRRTSLYPTLRHSYYPLADYDLIYSPRVFAFPNTDRPFAVISMAAERHPEVDPCADTFGTDYVHEESRERMRRKIQCVVHTALAKKHDVLVLGAWGCGAFGHPVRAVARLFAECLRGLAPDAFREVVFAVKVVRPSDQENLQAFCRAFRVPTPTL